MTSRALLAAWALFALPALLSGQDSKPDDAEARRIAHVLARVSGTGPAQ